MNLPQRALMPVVHAESEEQALRNVGVALDHGAHGVWLINHPPFPGSELLRIVREARARFSAAWLGVNLLSRTPDVAFHALGLLQKEGVQVDGLWTDRPMIAGVNPGCAAQDEIAAAREASGWEGEYYGGVAFKGQDDEPADLAGAVEAAKPYLDVIVTSGPGTGVAASREKVARVCEYALAGRDARPAGLASGVNEDNIQGFARLGVTRFLVATALGMDLGGGEKDFWNLDGAKVERMRQRLDRAL